MAAAAAVDWRAYRACPTCRVPAGYACRALSGRIAGGYPDGVAALLPHAHAHRKRSTRRTV